MVKPEELAQFDDHLLPSRRRTLELEFHQWCKNTGTRPDVFNVIGWLQEKNLMLNDRKMAILSTLRDEMKRMGWMQTAANIDEVIRVEE